MVCVRPPKIVFWLATVRASLAAQGLDLRFKLCFLGSGLYFLPQGLQDIHKDCKQIMRFIRGGGAGLPLHQRKPRPWATWSSEGFMSGEGG